MQRLLLALPFAFLASCSGQDGFDFESATIIGALGPAGLTSLETALEAGELDDDLSVLDGTFTLFAPVNGAFAALEPEALDALLDPANQEELVDVLSYHVLTTEADSATAVTLDGATALNGDDLIFDVIGEDLFINEARVVDADLDVTNGIIHEIDRILLPPESVVDTLVGRGFDTLVAAVTAADLADDLSGPGPFTVLAPTEDAFAALPAGTLDTLLMPENQDDLIELLQYHVVPGRVRASTALELETAATLDGRDVLFSTREGMAQVNGITIQIFNIPCTNGIVHVLDAVLTPPSDIPTTATDLGFSTLVAALQAAELDDDLAGAGPFTVFAPTEEAFAAVDPGALAALLEPANQAALIQLLQYHVVADSLTATEVLGSTTLTTLEGNTLAVTSNPPQVNNSGIVATNVLASNGIIHAINAVLVPPGFVFPASAPGLQPGAPGAQSLPGLSNPSLGALPWWSDQAEAIGATWSELAATQVAQTGEAHGLTAAEAEGTLLLESPALDRTKGRVLFTAGSARLRVHSESTQVPREIVLDGVATGWNLEAARLLLARGATIQKLAPDLIEEGEGGFRLTWYPREAGLSTAGFDLSLRGSEGAGVTALRALFLE